MHMPKFLLPSLNGYKAAYLKNDLISGIVVAALTIPVSMGYAQVAGLPPVYGLYASVLPVIGYALFASSPQLIFGIDASASAITSTILVAMGITAASDQAISTAAMLSLFTAGFLLLFALLRLGRFASFISFPVMSGFISGVSLSIIIGQIPKVMGIDSSGTDFFANIKNIVTEFLQTNLTSLVLGGVTLVVILICKKLLPKVPTALVMLVVGTAVTAIFHLDQQNVVITGDIPSGLPPINLPDFSDISSWGMTIGGSLVTAIVIFADSLLTTNSFALQGNYKVNDNQELFAFGISNAMSSLVGASPTSASVSRTAASKQFKGKSQLVSIVAAVVVTLVILFLAPLLYYMPQPVLSAITISALVGVVDIGVLRMLYRRSRMELVIWLAAALGVLLVGVLFGVIVGVVLSFVDVIIRATKPPQAFLGVIDGKEGYYDMARHLDAHAVPQGITIYRFTAALFFANISLFKKGIHSALKRDAKAIIIDASGISSVDISAAQGLQDIIKELKAKNIPFSFAGEIAKVDDALLEYGLKDFVNSGHTFKTLDEAVKYSQNELAKTPS